MTYSDTGLFASRRASQLGAVLLLLGGIAVTPSAAKDLNALAEFVTPAYTAMNFAMVCASGDPHFLAQTRGPRGHAINYAEHVKDEVIASLSHAEAVTALTAAADMARATSLRTLRAFNSQNPALEKARIREWCGREAMEFIRTFIADHDNNHEGLLSKVEEARNCTEVVHL